MGSSKGWKRKARVGSEGRGWVVASAWWRTRGERALACKSLCHREMLALAMRARWALRKGNWEARSMARPLPAPMSRKTVRSIGCGLVRWSQMSNKPWRIEGATP